MTLGNPLSLIILHRESPIMLLLLPYLHKRILAIQMPRSRSQMIPRLNYQSSSVVAAIIAVPRILLPGGVAILLRGKWSVPSLMSRRNIANGHFQLCNKCGLFERTHRKARPDQLAHRRQSTGNGRNTYQGSPIPVGPGQNGGAMPPMHNTYYSEAYHTQHSESFQPPPMPPPPPQMPSGSVHYRLRDPPSKQDTPANADYHNHIPPVDSEERRSSPRLSSAAAETAA